MVCYWLRTTGAVIKTKLSTLVGVGAIYLLSWIVLGPATCLQATQEPRHELSSCPRAFIKLCLCLLSPDSVSLSVVVYLRPDNTMDVMNTSSRYFMESPRGSVHQPSAHDIDQTSVFNLSCSRLVLVVIFLMTGMSLTTWRTTKRRKGAKILPGPWGGYWYIIQKHDLKITGFPFIGRVHDVDPTKPWVKITEWCSKYDGLFQTKMMGDTHIWISSTEIAHELLNKRYKERHTARDLTVLKVRSLKI